MAKKTLEESLAKCKKLGKILRDEIARSNSLTKNELEAVREAIRIQTKEREKSKTAEQELRHIREKKHKL